MLPVKIFTVGYLPGFQGITAVMHGILVNHET